ncbi:putative reverse transcriptase domain-containing protein [Tanacetum coccineum]
MGRELLLMIRKKRMWGSVRHRLVLLMLRTKFSSEDGLNAMLENGPWFIRNNSLILKKWNPDVNLQKEDVDSVPVWVKFHGVPMTAFSEDGLSIIATKLGTFLMLDTYTSC